MKIVFFGTPDYVLPVLTLVHKKFVTGPGKSPIIAVVTQSPKPFGRKKIPMYSAVDKWAHEHKIPIHYASRELSIDGVKADLGILASYGEIIPPEVIKLFPKGILVIHPSLLPKYRGSSPTSSAIVNGDHQTGVTIFKMDAKVDHGPIISQFKEDILPTDTGGSLRDRLFEKSAQVLVKLIEPYIKGKITPRTQDDSLATFTKILTKQDGYIELTKAKPTEAERFIRAMQPWPGAWTQIKIPGDDIKILRLKILKAHLEADKLQLDEVQPEAKGPVSWKQFMEAHPNAVFAAA